VRIAAAFAAALLAIGAVTAASLRSLSARRDWSRWIVHTQDVRLSIARVLTLATEAESAQRSYLLEGREESVESFRKAEEDLAREVDRLASLARDNSRQQERIAALRLLLQTRTQALRAPIEQRRGGDPAPPGTGEATYFTQRGRLLLAEMEDEETSLLMNRLGRLTRADRWSAAVTVGGALLLLVLAAAAALAVRDDLRRREEQARERARVLEYQQRLIAIAGHDLRNPLTAVLVSAQMLLQRREELRPAQANAVNRILRSAARIDALAGLLIDFTYARLGKGIPARASAMDALAIVERAIDELRETNPGREIRLESNAAALSGSWDPDRVSQLVSNLVSNALQYGARDAPVTVSLSRDAAGALEVRVHNQGPAIAAGLRPHLFEPHRRGEGAESAHPRGLGLGLFIVREIARAHGGSVEVRSDAQGTTFAVSLPDARPPPVSKGVDRQRETVATGLPAV